jgi:hypothetical protein
VRVDFRLVRMSMAVDVVPVTVRMRVNSALMVRMFLVSVIVVSGKRQARDGTQKTCKVHNSEDD